MPTEFDPGRLKDQSTSELLPHGQNEPLEIKDTIWFDTESDFSDLFLWRYLKLWQLESIVDSVQKGEGKLYFSKVSNLHDEDPTEGKMPDGLVEKQRQELARTLKKLDSTGSNEFAVSAIEEDQEFWERMREFSFVNCWNLDQIESNLTSSPR